MRTSSTTSVAPDPMHNSLLAALPATEREQLLPHLELVPLTLGQNVHAAGDTNVFFPDGAIFALLHATDDGGSVEISVVGNEGLVGIALWMGGTAALNQAVVQGPGHAWRLDGKVLREEFGHEGELQQLVLRYSQALLVQMTQTAACNWHHPVYQRLCRWLLLTLDRLPSNQLVMTQELVATILGVGADELAEAASKLQRLGAITFTRGQITILNRPQLERLACECYAVVKGASDRLFPPARQFMLRSII
ncbi:MAG: Crp/Fnr family transcriptional regulator [Xanthomonadaceae bacterium]|nr:Crp/Fnr family transcriptional regulator [Xanthomonadaceae bacterium]